MIIYLYFDCLSPHMFCLHASFEVTQRYPTIVAEADLNRPRFRPFKRQSLAHHRQGITLPDSLLGSGNTQKWGPPFIIDPQEEQL